MTHGGITLIRSLCQSVITDSGVIGGGGVGFHRGFVDTGFHRGFVGVGGCDTCGHAALGYGRGFGYGGYRAGYAMSAPLLLPTCPAPAMVAAPAVTYQAPVQVNETAVTTTTTTTRTFNTFGASSATYGY